MTRNFLILQTVRCLHDWDGGISFLAPTPWPSIFHLMFALCCQHRLAMMCLLWKERPSGLVLTLCVVFLITQVCFAVLTMTSNTEWVIMQSSMVVLTPPIYVHIVGKTVVFFFAPDNLWPIKSHTFPSPRGAVMTAFWPNFIDVVSLSTPCRISGKCCSSLLSILKWL